jgi:thiol-disulfide isomerase/thioredoxin
VSRLAALVAVLLLLSGCSSEKKDASVGQALPGVTLQPLAGGQAVDLSRLRGPLVINLWASWCGPCREELPHYQAFAQKYAGKVDVLGVDWQETRRDSAVKLARDSGVTYPLVADPKGQLRAQALPKIILVDRHGQVAHQEYAKITSVKTLEGLVHRYLGVGTS